MCGGGNAFQLLLFALGIAPLPLGLVVSFQIQPGRKKKKRRTRLFLEVGGREAQKGLIVIETVEGGVAERHFFYFFICEIVVSTQPAVENATKLFL